MSNISSIAAGTTHAPIVRKAGECAECGPAASAGLEVRTRPADSVNISELARRLAQRPTHDTLRPELVERIRTEIEAGEYDTPEKLDIALDRMIGGLDVTG